jgi:GTP-binding protein SAR1
MLCHISSSGNAASEDELRDTLGLFETTGKECKAVDQGMKPLEVYMCSVVKRMGYADGFRWLSNYL